MKTIQQILFDKNLKTERWQPLAVNEPHEYNFLTLIFPVLEYCYQQISQKILSNLLPHLSDDVVFETCKYDLINLFSPLISRVCVLELHIVNHMNFLQGDTPRALFEHYIQLLSEPENGFDLIQKYPILHKNLETYTEQYIEASQEFWQRLSIDKDALYALFLPNQNYRLTQVKTSGDKHKQGRAVSVLMFSDGKKECTIVYKPRSADIDSAYHELLVWFAERVPSTMAQHVGKVLPRDQYSWHEFITYEAAADTADIHLFYQRAGGSLAIMYLLLGHDIHAENLIAHNAYPVIVDLECLLHPEYVRNAEQSDAGSYPNVLSIGLLPYRILADGSYQGCDISALGGTGGYESPYHNVEWEDAGLVSMRVKRVRQTLLPNNNIPFLIDKKINPLHYAKDVVAGFMLYYQIILQHQEELLANNSPLEKFKEVPIRVVLRNTSDYAKLLFESYYPELLLSFEKTHAHFSWLKKQVTTFPELEKVLDYELADLATGNIPAFYTTGDDLKLIDANDQATDMVITQSGYQRIMKHLEEHIGLADLDKQVAMIVESYKTAL